MADKATSAARKEMIVVFVSSTVSETESKYERDHHHEIMMDCGIDITKARFVCFNGANSMSGETSDLQRHYQK